MSDFFSPRPAATPTIYAFAIAHPDHAGLLKVGYTERIAADEMADPLGIRLKRCSLQDTI